MPEAEYRADPGRPDGCPAVRLEGRGPSRPRLHSRRLSPVDAVAVTIGPLRRTISRIPGSLHGRSRRSPRPALSFRVAGATMTATLAWTRDDDVAARGVHRFLRRAAIGAIAGLAASFPLVATHEQAGWLVALAALVGAGHALTVRPGHGHPVDAAMTAAALGVPLWTVASVLAIPLVTTGEAAWTPYGMRERFPELAGWVVYGAILGAVGHAFSAVALRALGPERRPAPPPARPTTRVLILGGGFAGMTTAQALERKLGADPSFELTLVSETNALLFTPMLAEVAGSSLEPTHISSPLRTSLRRTNVVRARVVGVDLEARLVTLSRDEHVPGSDERSESTFTIAYDQLVLALGAVSNYLGMANVEKLAFDFKTLIDAIKIRNHAIDMLEAASREPDPARRREMLTFVVAGGGFAGVELAGALNDFCRGVLATTRA
ncbi:MAG: FAD-dependent oxidoreductase [Deltaproteobacteria bacterium]|nr:FAD-dependent oxidoreductase [Deltaproteobacteria bacterium]